MSCHVFADGHARALVKPGEWWTKDSTGKARSVLTGAGALFLMGRWRLPWIVLGLIAGFIGSKIVNRRDEGIVLDILLGVVGAFAGGRLFHIFGAPGVSGLNPYSLFVAVIGSAALLVLYHALRRRRAW